MSTGHQFFYVKGFGHIIVGADIQSDKTVRFIVSGRQKNNRNIIGLTDAATDLKSIHIRHHQIEDQKLRLITPEHIQRLTACFRCVYQTLILFKIRAEHIQ